MIRSNLSQRCAPGILAAVLLVVATPALTAPPDPVDKPDTPQHHEEHSFDWSAWGHDWHPALSLQYGWADPSREGFGGNFGAAGQLDLRIGYVRERRLAGEDDLVSQSTHGIVVGRFANSLASGTLAADEVGLDSWRFGFSTASGSGYRLGDGNMRLVLLTADTGAWYVTDLTGYAHTQLPPDDQAILARYDTATRYGESWESTARLCLTHSLAVQGGYERTVVLPGFKTWYWLLSSGINLAALTITDQFVEAVADASPHAAPVVAFLLRSGIEYGFYELRQKNMNWPFDTEAPLALDSFKLGFGMAF
jgi:hypothetical protein